MKACRRVPRKRRGREGRETGEESHAGARNWLRSCQASDQRSRCWQLSVLRTGVRCNCLQDVQLDVFIPSEILRHRPLDECLGRIFALASKTDTAALRRPRLVASRGPGMVPLYSPFTAMSTRTSSAVRASSRSHSSPFVSGTGTYGVIGSASGGEWCGRDCSAFCAVSRRRRGHGHGPASLVASVRLTPTPARLGSGPWTSHRWRRLCR